MPLFSFIRTLVMGYLNLGICQSNMSSCRGYFAYFFFLKCLSIVAFSYRIPQVNLFLGPELFCLFSLHMYTLNF